MAVVNVLRTLRFRHFDPLWAFELLKQRTDEATMPINSPFNVGAGEYLVTYNTIARMAEWLRRWP